MLTELVLNTRTLPEPLFHMICTEKFKVSETNGIIQLMPILDNGNGCPLRGIAADSGFTVDDFLKMKQDEKRLEL